MEETLFDLPNTPDEFGVVLPPSNLRRLNFSGLDYTTARKSIIEYIRTYYPDDFNDFVASNGIMMIMEIIAATTAKLSLRADILANEGFLPTAQTEEAVVNHLALINQRIKRQTPAICDIEITVDQPVFTDIEIDPGLTFSAFGGPDGAEIKYEVFRSPGDWNSNIVIPAGKRGVIAWGVEGNFASPFNAVSAGGANQIITIDEPNILEDPIFVDVTVGGSTESWDVISEPIERYGPNDKVVEVNFLEDSAIFRFGDDVTGRSPQAGSNIAFRYRTGGGIRGRIGVAQIDSTRPITPLPPANSSTSVRFRNISPSAGGVDGESLTQAKKRAPRDFATHNSIVTADDYAQTAASFSHPVYGSVVKSVATLRSSLNANRVDIYALALGPDNVPIAPNAGLKAGLRTYFEDLNVLTDHVVILDGSVLPVNIDMTVIINRNADASVIKEQSEQVLTDYFNISEWELGQEFYVSNLIEAIEAIDGISRVDLFAPVNNILRTGKLSNESEDGDGIGLDQIIIEGDRKTQYYYEKNQ